MSSLNEQSCPSAQLERNSSYSGLEIWNMVAGILAGLVVLFILMHIIIRVYRQWLGPAMGFNLKVEKMGEWAVITGGSDGIGKALAYEIAKRKVNVVLISRTLNKLQAVADDIAAKYQVKTKVIAVDFTRGYDVYDKIKSELSGLEIGTLINNVGMFYMQDTYYHKVKDIDKVCLDLIRCNVYSVQFMTNIILPQMAARKKGLIVNVSSVLGVIPTPFISIYGATKAYVQKLSTDLNLEYSKSGVFVQCVLPGSVSTNMSVMVENGATNLSSPAPEVYAQCVMKSLGMSDDTSAYFPHSFTRVLASIILTVIPETGKKMMRSYTLEEMVKKDIKLEDM